MTTISDLSLIIQIAERMKDPLAVKALMLDPANANPNPLSAHGPGWADLALAGGYPGLLLLFSELQKRGALKDESIVHNYVLKIKEAIETQGIYDLSLFSGLTGVCFALQEASCEGTRYQRMLSVLNNLLLSRIEKELLEPINARVKAGQPTASNFYDPIQGLAGIGRYVINNLTVPGFFELAQEITKTLILITHPLLIQGYTVPGWYLSEKDPLYSIFKQEVNGGFNLGLAHGIPSILAYLAMASMRNVEVVGQKDAMMRMITWIRKKTVVNNGAIRWPYSISLEEEIHNTSAKNVGSRDAWCYGVPGVAKSLLLASRALHDEELRKLALTAFEGIFARKREEWGLPGPTLCHGIAGLLLITSEMAKEPEGEIFINKVNQLRDILLSYYHPDYPYGFKDVEPCRGGGTAEVTKAGFLEGAAGVLLTILTLSEPGHSNWFLPLMIHI